MSLSSISIDQTLNLWSELERAFHGTGSYRHNAVEVWAYNLMPHSPPFEVLESFDSLHDFAERMESDAMSAFYDVLTRFSRNRHADIVINGRVLGKWVKQVRDMVRWEVQVVPRDAKLRDALHGQSIKNRAAEAVMVREVNDYLWCPKCDGFALSLNTHEETVSCESCGEMMQLKIAAQNGRVFAFWEQAGVQQ